MLKAEDVKPGVKVNYWAIVKQDGKKIGRIETEITSNLLTVSGELCCHIKGRVSVVSISHLELR